MLSLTNSHMLDFDPQCASPYALLAKVTLKNLSIIRENWDKTVDGNMKRYDAGYGAANK
jgi:hypothetical protein